jgi:tRNA1(Val) A37 N6-methylase TrmN6
MDIQSLNLIKVNYNINPTKILDIGANNGYFSDLCKSVWPNSNITAIEANPFWSSTLKEKNYNQLQIIQ